MPGLQSGYRARLMRAVHAEALKRHMDHDALHDMICTRYQLHSMGQATEPQLLALYREWTGKKLKVLHKKLRAGEKGSGEMVSGADLMALDQQFAVLGLAGGDRAAFIRRQLRGRDVIRTRGDWGKVMGGLRAMGRRAAA